ncbi:MAG: arginine deiminase family protein [Acidobacteriota bacterium]|nr:arginine deiminase family protein [Acidobacteriota bacterium]
MIHVYSEIGKLKTVMVHRPGNELKQIHPSMLEEMLFEDTPFLPSAQEEHDILTGILRNAGVQVLEMRDLFTDAMRDPWSRTSFTREFVEASNLPSEGLADSVHSHYESLDLDGFVETVYCGIRGSNPAISDVTTLAGLVSKQDLFMVKPLTNTHFTRDSSINVADSYILSRMRMEARRREPIMMRYVTQHAPAYKGKIVENLYDPKHPYVLEGGNFMILNRESICIGCSQRTEPQAIEILSEELFKRGFRAVYVFDLEKNRQNMYLDDMLSMVDHETFIYNPLLSGNVPVYRLTYDSYEESHAEFVSNDWREALCEALGTNAVNLIPCGGDDPIASAWETWNMGSNVLAIAPGEVVGFLRAEVTLDLLERAGIKVHAFAAPELSRGRGGCRCMCLPIDREDA